MDPVSMATEGQNLPRRLSVNHQPPGSLLFPEKEGQVKTSNTSLPQSAWYGMLMLSQSRQEFVQREDNQVVLGRG